ncbi:hypothetical protein HYT05_04275 [Candidatus Kaiserbacteria bacterium]|nr:hypothetical protein [Candidatus Kaiserbacteria bacterium]
MNCIALKKLGLSDEANRVLKKLGQAERVGDPDKTKIELLDKQIMTKEEMDKAFPTLDQALVELESKGLIKKFNATKGLCYGLTDKGSQLAR